MTLKEIEIQRFNLLEQMNDLKFQERETILILMLTIQMIFKLDFVELRNEI